MSNFDIFEFIPYEDDDARVLVPDAETMPCLLNGIYSIRSHINLDCSNRRYFTNNEIPDADRVPQIIHQALHFDIGAYVTSHSATLLLLTYEEFMAHIKELFLPIRWEFDYAYRLTKRQDDMDFLEWVSFIKDTNICLSGTVYKKTEAELLVWFKSAMDRNLWAAYVREFGFESREGMTDLVQWVQSVSEIAKDYERELVKPSRSAFLANAKPGTSFPNRLTPHRVTAGPTYSSFTSSKLPPRHVASSVFHQRTTTSALPL